MKWGVFFVQKWTFPQRRSQGALCTVSVFFILHFTYFRGAYAPNAPPPLPTGLDLVVAFVLFTFMLILMCFRVPAVSR